jgi:hypothetical protein
MITSKITITKHGPQQNCHAPAHGRQGCPIPALAARRKARYTDAMEKSLDASRAPLALLARLKENLSAVIRGKEEAINQVLVAMLADGHVLIEDVPVHRTHPTLRFLSVLAHPRPHAKPVFAQPA